jgi:hypothetical protein
VQDVEVLAVAAGRAVDLEAQKVIGSLRQERNVLDLVDAAKNRRARRGSLN